MWSWGGSVMASDGLHYGAVVVGGGHNGLVCAAYLARAGIKTIVLERRHLLGGAAVTEEVWPGFKVSTASYVVSLLSARIASELDLPRYGYHVYPLDPAYFAPFPDGSGFLLWDDPARAAGEIGKINARDGRAYLEYNRELGELADLVRPLREPEEHLAARGPDDDELRGLSRPLLRGRAGKGRARSRGCHRHVGRADEPRLRLRALAPQNGRDRRCDRRLGFRARRD